MTAKRAATAAVLSACLASGLVAVTAPGAQAATRKACVNKKSGELRILLKASKKCKKGWSKISFNNAGVTGASGPAGAVSVVSVRDATGAVVGQSLYSTDAWLLGTALVFTNDGAYAFNLTSGQVEESGGGVIYADAACTAGAGVTSVYDTPDYLAALTSFGRIVDRAGTGAARAYKPTATVRATNPTESFWYLTDAGTCQPSWRPSTIAALQPVDAPADRPGPLNIS